MNISFQNTFGIYFVFLIGCLLSGLNAQTNSNQTVIANNKNESMYGKNFAWLPKFKALLWEKKKKTKIFQANY